MIYYIIIKFFNNDLSSSKTVVLLSILYVSYLFVHYKFPMMIIGGFMVFLAVNKIFNIFNITLLDNVKLNTLKKLLFIFVILIFLQNFYFINLQHNSGSILTDFVNVWQYLINRIVSSQSGAITSQSGYVYTSQWLLFKKIWHILYVIVSIIVFLLIMWHAKINKFKLNSVVLLYIMILGFDATWMYTYFINYGGNFSFYLLDGWILNTLIYLPLIFLMRFYEHNHKKFIIYCISLLLAISMVLTSIFGTLFILYGYSPFPYQVRNEVMPLANFLISHYPHNIDTLVIGSLESSSAIYGHMSFYNYTVYSKIYPKPAIQYMIIPGKKRHKPINQIYKSIKKNIEGCNKIFVLTNYELKKGFYGGLAVSPLNNNDVKKFDKILKIEENIIYSSYYSKGYSL